MAKVPRSLGKLSSNITAFSGSQSGLIPIAKNGSQSILPAPHRVEFIILRPGIRIMSIHGITYSD